MAPLLKYSAFGLAALATVGGAVIMLAHSRWQSDTEQLRSRLAAAHREDGQPFSPADLDGLPGPVARYLAAAIRSGHPLVTHARIEWAGEFNMGQPASDRWVSFAAVQDFYPASPGMVWDARLRAAPAMPVFVRDAFVEGTGTMYGALLGVFPVVNSGGTDAMAVAALERYLGEAVWFPTALLPREGIDWTALDESRAVGTIRVGAISASVEFHFGPDGLVTSAFVPDRLFDDGRGMPHPEPWRARLADYRWEGGLLVPGRGVAEWVLPTGPYAYWRGGPTSVAYSIGQPTP